MLSQKHKAKENRQAYSWNGFKTLEKQLINTDRVNVAELQSVTKDK